MVRKYAYRMYVHLNSCRCHETWGTLLLIVREFSNAYDTIVTTHHHVTKFSSNFHRILVFASKSFQDIFYLSRRMIVNVRLLLMALAVTCHYDENHAFKQQQFFTFQQIGEPFHIAIKLLNFGNLLVNYLGSSLVQCFVPNGRHNQLI